MNSKQLITGIILLLRENVSGWGTTDGTDNVNPVMPPVDVSRSGYPWASVDVIGTSNVGEDIDNDGFVTDALIDITVFGIDTVDVVDMTDQSNQAVIDHHDGTDSGGDEYLPDWHLEENNGMTNILRMQPDPQIEGGTGHTRYQRVTEFTFRTATIKN